MFPFDDIVMMGQNKQQSIVEMKAEEDLVHRHTCNKILINISVYDILFENIIFTLRHRQNGCHFTDDIFKCIFLNENIWISIEIPLKFVPKSPIKNIPALVQITLWCWSGYKLLSWLMMVSLLTHIGFTWPQWVSTWNAHHTQVTASIFGQQHPFSGNSLHFWGTPSIFNW